MTANAPALSVVIITYNEENRIEECLQSVRFAGEIIIVDSYSTDRTKEIAERFPVRFSERKFDNFSSQKNHALSLASGNWILLIDADERVSPELRSEIQALLASHPANCAYEIKRTAYFFGKPLRYSGTQTDAPIRLFPRGSVRYEQLIHEKIVTPLSVRRLQSKLIHHTTENMAQFTQKLGPYMKLEIETLKNGQKPVTVLDIYGRPAARFFQRLFLQGGLLDGMTGLRFAVLSAYYEFKKWNGYRREIKK